MAGGVAKAERRLTKIRKVSNQRPKTSERDGLSDWTASKTQEDLHSPMLTDCRSLRSSSTTRLQLYEQSANTVPSSQLSLVTDMTSPPEIADDRPSTYYGTHEERSPLPTSYTLDRSEESQTIDVPAAIALLQELKKHATAEELVALHKALLPTRRSVESPETLHAQHDASDTRYAPHRRSRVLPGLATRGGPESDPLQTIEELAARQKLHQGHGRRSSANVDAQRADHPGATSFRPTGSVRTLLNYRSASPSSHDDMQAGVYRTGTLRITNRSPSPAPATQHVNGLDGTFDALNGTRGWHYHADTDSRTADHLHASAQAYSSSKVAVNAVIEEYSEFRANPYDRNSAHPLATDLTSHASSSSCESLNTPAAPQPTQDFSAMYASAEKATQDFQSSPDDVAGHIDTDRPFLVHNADSGYASEVSSDRQSHSLENKRTLTTLTTASTAPTAFVAPKSAHSAQRGHSDNLTASAHLLVPRSDSDGQSTSASKSAEPLRASQPPRLPRSPRVPPPEVAELLGLRPSRQHSRSKSPKPPKSPKPARSVKSVRSTKTHQSIREVSDVMPSQQRLEDIFVASEEPRPKSRRRTLFSSLGFGKKGESRMHESLNIDIPDMPKCADPIVAVVTLEQKNDLAPSPMPEQTAAGEVEGRPSKQEDFKKNEKRPNKLKKSASRRVKEARKELARFDENKLEPPPASRDSHHHRGDGDDSVDTQPDWFWHDDFSMPRVPTVVRTVQQAFPPDLGAQQYYEHPVRRRRNLSVVEEIDHDSMADQEHPDALNPLRGAPLQERQQCPYQLPETMFDTRLSFDHTAFRPVSFTFLDLPIDPPFCRRATHQPNLSIASTLSSMTSGQMELIEEVQNATIDWAVQAKFWKARRTLVGNAFQQDTAQKYRVVEEAEAVAVAGNEVPVKLQNQTFTDDYSHNVNNDLHMDGDYDINKDFSSKFRNVQPSGTQTTTPLRESGFPKRHSSLIAREQVTVIHTAAETDKVFDRYSGGLQYEWTRETGVNGSAGTSYGRAVENGRSAPSKVQYGLDLSDVPVFIMKR